MTPRLRIEWLVVGLLLVLTLSGCGKGGPSGGAPEGRAVSVVGFRALKQPVKERVAVVGTLVANESVDIKSKIDGVIEAILFEEGQKVEEGMELLWIDQRKLEASLAEAEANLTLAESTLDRYTALAQTRAVSGQEVDQARSTYQVRLATVELMRAQLEDATVIAPFEGRLGARLVSIGQYVNKGQGLTSLMDMDPMKVELNVPERFLGRLEVGQVLEVSVAAYPQERFSGRVYFVDPRVDTDTRTVLVKARVPNPKEKLRAGMFASLDLILQVRENAVVIPESALLLMADEASVFVVEDGKAQPRSVTTGVRMAKALEIRSGLSAGEMVVIEGTQKLAPGVSVKVREETRSLDEILETFSGTFLGGTVR